MTVALSYLDDLSRVRITGSALSGSSALVERSLDQIRWQVVRGGSAVPVAAGAFHLDDYEFPPNIQAFYRVTVLDPDPITFVAAGTASTGSSGSRTPGLPAGLLTGDALLVLASTRNTGTGTVNTPTGYTLLMDGENFRLFGKIAAGGEVAPTVTFTGGAANEDTLAQTAAFRGATLADFQAVDQLNGGATNIATPALTPDVDNCVALVLGWRQNDFDTATFGMTEIAEVNSTAGNDAGMAWYYSIQTTATAIPADTITITQGLPATPPSRGAVVALRRSSGASETQSITVALDRMWLKSITRPFLNRPVVLQQFSAVERSARNGAFAVVGRSLPVAVTDVRGGRQQTISLLTTTAGERDELDMVLAAGDPMFLHVPITGLVDTMYVVIGDTTYAPAAKLSPENIFTLPLTEVAAPHHGIVGATNTWQGVLNTYATWADVLAGNATWQELLDQIGDVADVVVP